MSECEICGEVDNLTRTCNYCGAKVCPSHTLPEKHNCPSVRASDAGKHFESSFEATIGEERPRKPERESPKSMDRNKVRTYGTEKAVENLPSSPPVRTKSDNDDDRDDKRNDVRRRVKQMQFVDRIKGTARKLRYKSQFVASTVLSVRFFFICLLGIATVGQLGLVGVPGLPTDADPADAVEDVQRAVANVTDEETSGEANPGADLQGLDPYEVERLFIERLNEERERRGVQTVERWETLSEMGRNHSRSMAEHDYVGFEEPDDGDTSERYAERGLLPACRLDVQGSNRYYEGVELVYQTYVYEDVEASWASGGTYLINSEEDFARVLFKSWMGSADNRDAMLVYSAERAGLGIEITDGGKAYATLELC